MAVAITEESSACFASLQPLWHHKAPRQLIENCPAADPLAGWKSWQQHLRKRKKPAATPFLKKKQSPMLWGWPPEWERDAIQAALETPTILAEVVIGDDAVVTPDLPHALQLVMLAYALPRLARELPADKWWLLAERLHTIATQAHSERIDWATDPHNVVRNQLLAGELPLALGYLFPEVRALHDLRNDARSALSEALLELTDGQGLPHARLLQVLGPLLACWTRTRWLGQRMRGGAWSGEAELQFEWLVRHVIRLADVDGRFLLSSTHIDEHSWSKPLLKMAIALAGDRSDRAAAVTALPRGIVPKQKSNASKLPGPSLNSDWSGISIMSNGWSQSDARLALSYPDNHVTIELTVDGERLLMGELASNTLCDDQPVEAAGEWEQLCWESGPRFDFLELGRKLSAGLRLERQILFARDDQILYLADIILAGEGATRRLQHSLELPLADNVRWIAESETRDGILSSNKMHAAVLPLALQEWRANPRGGSLLETDGRLILTQQANGHAICCPLMLDLKRKRSNKVRTWRQLTVGQDMEIVPADVAVGFRAQSGNDQWVVYRSLAPPGNRTVLGLNISGEFSAGRFLKTGKFKEWIEIEAL